MKDLKKELEMIFKDMSGDILETNRMIINVKKEQILTVLRFLKDKGYNYLILISCIDWIEKKEFELVYILSDYMQKEIIILKTTASREKPEFVSSIPVFKNAEPYERELHELFGINFEGHPRLTQLFLERNYEIPPFRKDFDTRKYVKEVFDKIPFVGD